MGRDAYMSAHKTELLERARGMLGVGARYKDVKNKASTLARHGFLNMADDTQQIEMLPEWCECVSHAVAEKELKRRRVAAMLAQEQPDLEPMVEPENTAATPPPTAPQQPPPQRGPGPPTRPFSELTWRRRRDLVIELVDTLKQHCPSVIDLVQMLQATIKRCEDEWPGCATELTPATPTTASGEPCRCSSLSPALCLLRQTPCIQQNAAALLAVDKAILVSGVSRREARRRGLAMSRKAVRRAREGPDQPPPRLGRPRKSLDPKFIKDVSAAWIRNKF